MKPILSIVLGLMAGALFLGQPAAAQGDASGPTLEEQREAARIDRLWNRMWREAAPFYIEHDGGFVCVPGFDRRLPSSLGVSFADYREQSVWDQEYTDERGREQTRRLVKPEEEAMAAVGSIPEVAVGQYGYIHSGNIQRIIDDSTLILEDIWLLDAAAAEEEKKELKAAVVTGIAEDVEGAIRDRGRDARRNRGDGIIRRRAAENESIDWAFEERTDAARRQRGRAFSRFEWEVVGYRTNRLAEDARWPAGRAAEEGLQVIIVAVSGNSVTAVPIDALGRGLTEIQFLDCLAERGLTKAEYVEMVTEAKRASRTDYMDIVIAQLEGEDSPVADETRDEGGNDTVELAD